LQAAIETIIVPFVTDSDERYCSQDGALAGRVLARRIVKE
jgi:hypothetical protein